MRRPRLPLTAATHARVCVCVEHSDVHRCSLKTTFRAASFHVRGNSSSASRSSSSFSVACNHHLIDFSCFHTRERRFKKSFKSVSKQMSAPAATGDSYERKWETQVSTITRTLLLLLLLFCRGCCCCCCDLFTLVLSLFL